MRETAVRFPWLPSLHTQITDIKRVVVLVLMLIPHSFLAPHSERSTLMSPRKHYKMSNGAQHFSHVHMESGTIQIIHLVPLFSPPLLSGLSYFCGDENR